MALSIHDVLRAIVTGAREVLNDPKWIDEAVAAIDRHEQQNAPKPAEPAQGEVPAAVQQEGPPL